MRVRFMAWFGIYGMVWEGVPRTHTVYRASGKQSAPGKWGLGARMPMHHALRLPCKVGPMSD